MVSRPALRPLTPFRAQQLLNPTGSGTLPTGIFVNKETSHLLISGHNQTWYRQQNYCLDHLCFVGRGSAKHEKAMKEYRKKEHQKITSTACRNLFRAAIADVKLGAAGKHFETIISLLASCSVDVGSIGHSRNNVNHIMYCLEKVLDERTGAWLAKPLPSTLLPPHFWATTNKATPRTTNQAVLIVARDSSGTPCPIPVAAPEIYNDFKDATYDSLAKQLLDAISEHFSFQILSHLCGVGADGPYQATGFRQHLREALDLDSDDDLALPVTWDTAHLLNLAVTDVRDAKTESGIFFRQFIKRCNVFNHVLSNGKGFAFLQLVNVDARRPVSCATQRFASSSYEQWIKLEKSFNSLWRAFDLLHPNHAEDEEWQYMIAGSDFVHDLLAFPDILSLVVDLMLHVQALDTRIWKLKLWWPKVREKLMKAANEDPEAFPRLKEVEQNLRAGGVFVEKILEKNASIGL